MRVEIVTPEQAVLECECVQVRVPGMQSSFAMLRGHEPIISPLVEGEVHITGSDGKLQRVRVWGTSVVEQRYDLVKILATRAELIDEEGAGE